MLAPLTTRYLVGDVLATLADMPASSVDLVMCSPPFLALRSYLPADHPDKAAEIGSEATPAEYLDALLEVVVACRRVLTPHGSLVFELGDTYSGSGGGGGDYDVGGLREGQARFEGSALAERKAHQDQRNAQRKFRQVGSREHRPEREGTTADGGARVVPEAGGDGWPLPKSLCGIPTLFAWSLAYGRNLLGGAELERWRVRNVIAWCRPNPPVGALGDKCRPATSYLTVACTSGQRWFDMDAVRTPPQLITGRAIDGNNVKGSDELSHRFAERLYSNPAGSPLLDYWEIPTQPYAGAHYATFPEELPRRVILLMAPERVCRVCGEPSRRITENQRDGYGPSSPYHGKGNPNRQDNGASGYPTAEYVTVGWTDCGHDDWRPGVVLDPFAGSGTTLRMALGNGRSSVGIDIDERNAELALERVGPLFMDVERHNARYGQAVNE